MKPPHFIRKNLQAILSGSYTPFELREFVQICYDLALPLIRTKIAIGKINLEIMGLKEQDVVYDCLADLFYRDEQGNFPRIRTFFEDHIKQFENASEEQLIGTLRYLIFGRVNNSIIRLYSEADPALGKILRNMKLALDRSKLFERVFRLGETHLIPRDADPLLHLPPIPFERLREACTRVILLHDTIPDMLTKLHGILIDQTEYRRRISLVTAALLFKEIYQLDWKAEQTVREVLGQEASFVGETEAKDLSKVAKEICQRVGTEMYETYVTSGKRSEQVFRSYMLAVNEILLIEFLDAQGGEVSYYDCLKSQIPDLDKQTYAREHRSVLKYLAKIAKDRMRQVLKKY